MTDVDIAPEQAREVFHQHACPSCGSTFGCLVRACLGPERVVLDIDPALFGRPLTQDEKWRVTRVLETWAAADMAAWPEACDRITFTLARKPARSSGLTNGMLRSGERTRAEVVPVAPRKPQPTAAAPKKPARVPALRLPRRLQLARALSVQRGRGDAGAPRRGREAAPGGRERLMRQSIRALDAAVGVITTLLDGGELRLYDGVRSRSPDAAVPARDVLLVACPFGAPAFERARNGEAVARPLGVALIRASGAPTWFRAVSAAGRVVFDGDVGLEGSYADVQIPAASLMAGGEFAIGSMTYRLPAGS